MDEQEGEEMKDVMTVYMILVTPENEPPYFMYNHYGNVWFSSKANARQCLNHHINRVRAEQAKVEIVKYNLSGGELQALWDFGPCCCNC